MLTGDNRVTAEAVARQLEIDEVRADVLPAEKRTVVQELQQAGRRRRDGGRWGQRRAGARRGGRRDRDGDGD